MRNKKLPLLLLVLLLATILRLVSLNKVPVELFGDELDVGYHAYSLLKTGRDYTGHFLPSYISSLAESRAPLFIYSAVPFVAIFGLNEWGVRLPAVFFGVLGIWFLYSLIQELFRKADSITNHLSPITCFFLAIVPWHFHFSRAGFEVTLLLFLFLAGAYFFLKGLRKARFLILAAVFLSLTIYAYSTAVVFLPLLLASLFLIFRREISKIDKKILGSSLVLALIILLPFVKNFFSGKAGERFARIGIFADQKLIDKEIIEKRIVARGDERLFHNKLSIWAGEFGKNYLRAFSPQFLFLEGDINPRHNVGRFGELYLAFLPLLILGIWTGVKNLKQQSWQLIFSWLLLASIPAALTQDGGGHATRLFLMLPPLAVLIGLGAIELARWVKASKFPLTSSSAIFLLLVVSCASFFHQYFVHWPKESWQFWHYGYKEIFTSLDKEKDNFDKVVINNAHEPTLLRFLFWTKADPQWFQQNFSGDKEKPEILLGFNGFSVGKYYFGRLSGEQKAEKLINFLTPETLYLAFQKDEVPGDWDWHKEPPAGIKILKMVKNPLGEPYIYLLTKERI